MQLKDYQIKSVEQLLSVTKKLLVKNGTHSCVIKAPTGSGKTIMVAEWFSLLASENLDKPYAFIWISGNNLHKQSKTKLEPYLRDTRYTLSYLDGITGNEFLENEIIFVNWHSLTKQDRQTGEYTNVFMRDNEADRNLKTFVNNTKEKGIGIILIVDECHYHYWSNQSQDLVKSIIDPSLILEVSATPSVVPSPDDIANGEAGYVVVNFEDVIAEGMIKREVIINAEISDNIDFKSVADEVILKTAIKKRDELAEIYKNNNIGINPLLLIQLPSEGEKTSVLDESMMEKVINELKNNHAITLDNGKLGIWLSEEKENLENIEQLDNQVEVLIFKQAIALGWDCPRAQLLVMLREIRSRVFEVQTVGRILRMPQAKHYDILDLDRAYVYTNIDRIAIKDEKDSKGLFQVYPSHRKPEYKNIGLPSVYLKRVDYGDLTLKFRRLFKEEANKYFDITEQDLPPIAKNKADVKLDLEPNELGQAVIVDAIFTNIDIQTKNEITGDNIVFAVSEDEIKHKFETFAKLSSLPYAPVRSCNKIQMAIYDWFDTYIGYKNNSRLDIQRIVVCSEKNQKVFHEIIESAKSRFKEERTKEINSTNRKKESNWDVPFVEYFNENYEMFNTPNYTHDKCYLRLNRSQPEKDFERLLSDNANVSWWYKNGVEKEIYFSLEYQDAKTSIMRSFYPDYIVYFIDGSIGIYDTKSGITAEIEETKQKSNSLQAYIQLQISNGKQVKGGIVQVTQSGMHVFTGLNYSSDISHEGWNRLEF